ncbi:OsmC family protein [Aliifodinibius sp. S!AR15-10]|uniref:OsmC family protein n=1 Tax=Aliifodinibius sp. S!AR15-10 TaxID=2950437 RepID=UPI0028631B90|nr:OsmC family protein [Aliifodinibius sp. S!AR15-10]MDR8393467.1 OsmC family protein [Aliifodinibius sp. S!AR15-10]
MDSNELRAMQAPLKKKYLEKPEEGEWTLHAEGTLGKNLACHVETHIGTVESGLHPATGGDGTQACSGDMLLQALVACAGVTLNSVATAMGIELKDAKVRADGDLDFRGTLGVSRDTPVGFKNIRMTFELDSGADPKKLKKLIDLTERYCVVYQTLQNSPEISVKLTRN